MQKRPPKIWKRAGFDSKEEYLKSIGKEKNKMEVDRNDVACCVLFACFWIIIFIPLFIVIILYGAVR